MSENHPMPTNKRFKNLCGMKFGMLTVKSFAGRNEYGDRRWNCVCDCGQTCVILGNQMVRGVTKSCGCFRKVFRRTHGCSLGTTKTPEYQAWLGLKTRCNDESSVHFRHYGGRGIKVCERWCTSFANFLADMGLRPSPTHSIDRIDNNGNYEPGNCRWATKKQQLRNKRTSRRIDFNGELLCVAEWADRLGLTQECIRGRLNRGDTDPARILRCS